MPRPIKPPRTPELAAVESTVQQLLSARDFAGAVGAVAAYEAKQAVPRGMGIDWATRDGGGEVAGLKSIYAAPAEDAVRSAAAQMYLWGVSRPYRRWLARESGGDGRAQELVIAAYKAQQAFYDEQAFLKFGIRVRHPT